MKNMIKNLLTPTIVKRIYSKERKKIYDTVYDQLNQEYQRAKFYESRQMMYTNDAKIMELMDKLLECEKKHKKQLEALEIKHVKRIKGFMELVDLEYKRGVADGNKSRKKAVTNG